MRELNLLHDRPFRKSAKITGDVTGNYHPHGTAAVYETMVRLAQPFSMRYPLVDGQGTSARSTGTPRRRSGTRKRSTEFAEEMLRDMDKDTVDMRPNYDESREEPVVLPAAVPNRERLLGIAVGMATNVPPHKLREIVDATIHVIDNPDCPIETCSGSSRAPTSRRRGSSTAARESSTATRPGAGTSPSARTRRSRSTRADREAIIVTEIPYMVSKAALLEKIADLVKDGTLEGSPTSATSPTARACGS